MSAAKSKEYVIVDVETTGLDTLTDDIIELSAVKIRRGLVVAEFSSLVHVDRTIPENIAALTGIDNTMLEGQPEIGPVMTDFDIFAGDAELCAHNASFDCQFLRRHWADEREWLDTLTLAQIAWPCAPGYSLAMLCLFLEIDNTQAHRALSDAKAEAELFLRIDRQLDSLPLPAKEDILLLLQGDESPMGSFLRHKCATPGAVSQPSAAEQEPRSREKRRRLVDEDYRLNQHLLEQYLGPDSICRERIDGFEERPQQLRMAQAVARTFNEGGALLVEAGTGTGKSLGYLLPSALYAEGSGKQVAISTYTRNLQEQLLNKDIPMLGRLLDHPISAAALKGRSNYLCRRLYKYYLDQPPENMRYFLARVAVWKAQSSDGDGGSMNITSFDRWKWQRICAAKENCAPFCPFGRHNACLVQKARFKAGEADILILNHSLLVANAAVDKGFLPEMPCLVLDEAQHLEEAAEDQLSSQVDIFSLLNMTSRLKRREHNRDSGACAYLFRYVEEIQERALFQTAVDGLNLTEQNVDDVMEAGERFFTVLGSFFTEDVQRHAFYPAQIRILPLHRQAEGWPLVLELGEELAAALAKLATDGFKLLDILLAYSQQQEEETRPAGADELQTAAAMARQQADTLRAALEVDENYVSWVEISESGKKPSLNLAPIDISQLLHDCLYAGSQSMVFTSATLAAGKDFSYYKHRHGLDLLEDQPREMMVSSPFDYHRQAALTVINDLPDWSKCREVESVEAVSRALVAVLSASQGRAIVLFTSHHQLKAVYEQIRGPLRQTGVTVLAHGVSGAPSTLLQRLKQEPRCCILGANSFWEGVDVIGNALSLIVVVRLPFWPPNTPLAASRMELIESQGGSPFRDYSLPQALIRFKQGFGRLIRSDSDSGIFCVLDRRILEKNYGRSFLNSLPDMERRFGSTREIATLIQQRLIESEQP